MEVSSNLDKATEECTTYIFDLWSKGESVGSAEELQASIKKYPGYYASFFWGIVDACCQTREMEDSEAFAVWIVVYASIMVRLHGNDEFNPEAHAAPMRAAPQAELGSPQWSMTMLGGNLFMAEKPGPSGLWGVKSMIEERFVSESKSKFGCAIPFIAFLSVAVTIW